MGKRCTESFWLYACSLTFFSVWIKWLDCVRRHSIVRRIHYAAGEFIGKPSVKHGISYPVFARLSMGVYGANFPAMIRGVVAIFWYGAQTYFAATAVSLLINSLIGASGDSGTFMGLTAVDWLSLIIVSVFQIYLFWRGIEQIRRFLNFAGPAVYAIMIALMIVIWSKSGSDLLSHAGAIFSGTGSYSAAQSQHLSPSLARWCLIFPR